MVHGVQHEVRGHVLPREPLLLPAGAEPRVPEAHQEDKAVQEDEDDAVGGRKGFGGRDMPEATEQQGQWKMLMRSQHQATAGKPPEGLSRVLAEDARGRELVHPEEARAELEGELRPPT